MGPERKRLNKYTKNVPAVQNQQKREKLKSCFSAVAAVGIFNHCFITAVFKENFFNRITFKLCMYKENNTRPSESLAPFFLHY